MQGFFIGQHMGPWVRSPSSLPTLTSHPDSDIRAVAERESGQRTRLGPVVPPLVTPGAARLGHPAAGDLQIQL